MPLVAGVDSSTQSTKVQIRDLDSGVLVAEGRAAHPVVTPPVSQQDPASWLAAFSDAWDQGTATLTAAARSRRDVVAISVAGQQHGMVACDPTGVPLHPAVLWNDTTAAPDADRLIGRLPGGAAGWAQACGSVPVAAFTIAKLSWLHRTAPEVWSRVQRVCLPHDWLTWQLTGQFVTDRGDASGTGYWSPAGGGYRWDLLAFVDEERDWSTALPRVLDPAEPAGMWSVDGVEVLVAAGTGDNMAAALGIGVLPGDVVISIGTSGTIFTVAESPTADPSGAVAGFADANGRFLPLVCTLNAAKVTDAIARLLGVDASDLDALALAAEPGAGGVTVVPYFDGERTPNLPEATGSITGLRTDVRPEQLARAAVEGVVGGLLAGRDALAAHAPIDTDRLWLVGGGARSAAYRQVFAEWTGAEILTSAIDEVVALGACVQAAAAFTASDPDDVRQAWGSLQA